MSKTAKDYPVTFGYNQVWGNYTHKGEDRAMPTGVEVWVEGTRIGLSGNTGFSTGPHLHGQAGTDEWCQNTYAPTRAWWKGVRVKHVGYGDQWGNFVIVEYKDSLRRTRYMCYAHLSRIDVAPGDAIKPKGDEMITSEQMTDLYRHFLKRGVDSAAKKQIGKVTYAAKRAAILRSSEYRARVAESNKTSYPIKEHAPAEIRKDYPACDKSAELKKIAELTKALNDIEKIAEEAQNGLKSDLSKANEEIRGLTSKVEELNTTIEEETAPARTIERMLVIIKEYLTRFFK